jgi:mono/diheme cytochrome c family protein
MNPGDPIKPATPNADGPEPTVDLSPVPIWLVVVFGALIYWCQLFLDGHAGGFSKDVYAPYHDFDQVAMANPQDPEARVRARGREIFTATCSACHQPNGMGKEGTAPPLVGSEWVLAHGGDRIVRIDLNGLTGPITVKGQEWNLSMTPFGEVYTKDEDIAAVLTFIRTKLGDNNAGPISPDLVRAARAEKHPGPETSQELLKIPVQ